MMDKARESLKIYDASTDERRPATQEDIDRLQEFADTISFMNCKLNEERKPTQTMDLNFKLAVYPNRMRTDSVFVAEDRPIEPYANHHNLDGGLCYPSVPQKGYVIGSGLPHAFAYELVRRWNAASK